MRPILLLCLISCSCCSFAAISQQGCTNTLPNAIPAQYKNNFCHQVVQTEQRIHEGYAKTKEWAGDLKARVLRRKQEITESN
jgi:hypothetical protein